MLSNNYPAAQGLYDPANEHDACGVAMVATLNREAEHEIVQKALRALENMEHRGATGADPDTGDGAGILIRIPDEFFRAVVDFKLPEVGKYAAGLAFIEQGANVRAEIEKLAAEENLIILGWREVPTDSKTLGKSAISVMPKFEELFIAGKNGESG
ncbi:MAG: glutamate synthase subunit alpha, partial [Candidatus Nanopelagicaceae bacterium]